MLIANNPWQLLGIENNPLHLQKPAIVLEKIINNLHYLLNTRKPELKELNCVGDQAGILCFGLEDLSRFNPESPKHCAELCEALKTAITKYEPRLAQLSIELIKTTSLRYYELVFRISAVLNIDEIANDVQLESVFSLECLSFSLKEIEDD